MKRSLPSSLLSVLPGTLDCATDDAWDEDVKELRLSWVDDVQTSLLNSTEQTVSLSSTPLLSTSSQRRLLQLTDAAHSIVITRIGNKLQCPLITGLYSRLQMQVCVYYLNANATAPVLHVNS